ncbi:ROK family protein [Microbacterium oxydans]|nr:ROK family protein [Microbacterium oxydans]
MLHANAKYDFLEDIDLHAWAHTEFDLPSVVENDARAALIGETSSGSAAGERDAVLVTLGTGIGTAAMIDGSPLRGTHRPRRDPGRTPHRRHRRPHLPVREHRLRRSTGEHQSTPRARLHGAGLHHGRAP